MAAVTYSTGATGGTTAISPFGSETQADIPPYLNISISGTWVGTVALQRSFDSGSNWLTVKSYTSNAEEAVEDYERGVVYRLYFTRTGGTATLRLSNCEA